MNSDFDDVQLEAEIDRQLKDLPDLIAPRGLMSTTMQLIARPKPAPWYSRSWATWPASLRAAYVVVASGLLASTVFALRAVQQDLLVPMYARVAHWGAGFVWLWNAASTLAGAGAAILNQASRGTVLSCVLAMVLAYATCIGFGTLFVKLALSGPKKNEL